MASSSYSTLFIKFHFAGADKVVVVVVALKVEWKTFSILVKKF